MKFSDVEGFIRSAESIPFVTPIYYFRITVGKKNLRVSDLDLRAALNTYRKGTFDERAVVLYLTIAGNSSQCDKAIEDDFNVDEFLQYESNRPEVETPKRKSARYSEENTLVANRLQQA